jgi:outer membrane protein assembly factor BamA
MDPLRMHLFDVSMSFDSRNVQSNPSAGWYADASYERGRGRRSLDPLVDPNPGAPAQPTRVRYGRAFFDFRKYNRISPASQLNARLAFGGWLHGDRMPLERRLSVGGIGTLPGFDFRIVGLGTDVGQCSTPLSSPEGRPAQCDRVALAQIEYRQELHSTLIDVFNRNGIRVRGTALYVRPAAVVFADGGRGWLVGSRDGDLRYPSGSFPALKTFRTDVGVGIDLGMGGLYVAKAVSEPKESANFFIRLRNRF